jgi:hypothetical protein
LSQVEVEAAFAVPATAKGAPTATAPTMARRTSFRARWESGREVISVSPDRISEANVLVSGLYISPLITISGDHEWRGGRPS